MDHITRKAFAKINLTLDVGERRPDGYHSIRSVMQTIDLCDRLTVARDVQTPGVRLEVTGPEADGVPADTSNLVTRAAAHLQIVEAEWGNLSRRESGLHITLEKNIPSQAGLGGGSSDAAAALRALNTLFDLRLSLRQLMEIGAQIGADVPFFLTGGTAIVEGVGEQVRPLAALTPPWTLVLIKPQVGVSTAEAYAALDAIPNRLPRRDTDNWAAARAPRPLGNDFEQAIIPAVPEIARIVAFFKTAPEIAAEDTPLLCGSGSAVVCRVRSRSAAQRLAGRARAESLGTVWVTQTMSESADP